MIPIYISLCELFSLANGPYNFNSIFSTQFVNDPKPHEWLTSGQSVKKTTNLEAKEPMAFVSRETRAKLNLCKSMFSDTLFTIARIIVIVHLLVVQSFMFLSLICVFNLAGCLWIFLCIVKTATKFIWRCQRSLYSIRRALLPSTQTTQFTCVEHRHTNDCSPNDILD